MFINWRLYSWIRLTCTSNMASGETWIPVSRKIRRASRSLLARLIAAKRSWKTSSSTNLRSPLHPETKQER